MNYWVRFPYVNSSTKTKNTGVFYLKVFKGGTAVVTDDSDQKFFFFVQMEFDTGR